MSVALETIVNPNVSQPITPIGFTKPGAVGAPMVRIAVGFTGQVKTLGWSMSATATTKMGQAHHENPPSNSESLQKQLAQAAGG
jgi:hypothetical protein